MMILTISILNKNEVNNEKHIRYVVKFINWNEAVKIRCTKNFKGKNILMKSCIFSKELEWKEKFKNILKTKNKKFWYVKITTKCIDYFDFMYDGMRMFSSNYYIFFISKINNEILYKTSNGNLNCSNNL